MPENTASVCRYCDGRGSWQASKDPDEISYCTFCDGGMRQERWRAILGFEGLYEVSDMGRVRNPRTGHVMAVTTKPSGHQRVRLSRGSFQKFFYVHRLVLTAFVGPCPEGMEGCHYDGDATHNDVNNLRWDTHLANANDKRRHGSEHNTTKSHCPRGHLLKSPNLRSAHLKKGQRSCLACAYARTTVHRNGGDLQQLADEHFSRITRGATTVHKGTDYQDEIECLSCNGSGRQNTKHEIRRQGND